MTKTTSDFVRFVDAGIDWITITCDDPIKKTQVELHVQKLTHQLRKLGEVVSPWSMYGFEGLRVSSLQYGWRDDAILVRASSDTASMSWRKLGKLATGCSRLDIMATVEYKSQPNQITKNHLRQMTRWRRRRKSAPALSIFHDADGPSTVYVGKRISDRFGRIYNKAAESGMDQYRNSVRYELELKNAAAMVALREMLIEADEAKAAIAICRQYFGDRGAYLEWPAEVGKLIVSPRSRSTAEKRLRWLADSVKGTVQELIDCGRLSEVLAALGLNEAMLVHMDQLTSTSTTLKEVH